MNWKYENGRIYSADEKGELMCETTFIRKENGEMDVVTVTKFISGG